MHRCIFVIIGLFVIGSGATLAHDEAVGRDLSDPTLSRYSSEVTEAARAFVATLSDEQLRSGLAPFDSRERFTGRDTADTPSFCAVLAWCVGWGLPLCSLETAQQQALSRLLSTALSDSGYQTVRAILNGHRVIGELEEAADAGYIGEVARQCGSLEADSLFGIPATCRPDGRDPPDYVAQGGARPSKDAGGYTLAWEWPGGVPGLVKRHQHFCDHTIVLFGEPGSDRWAFRFEGHHVTINITFARDPETGHLRVDATPLFLGSFPLIVPPSPDPSDLSLETTWVAGQELMRETLDHARQFLGALPATVSRDAHIADGNFLQAPPLRMMTFPNWLLSSVQPDPNVPLPFNPVMTSTDALDGDALWHLRLLFRRYFDTLHPVIGDRYRDRLDHLIASPTKLEVLWAGDSPSVPGGLLFLHVSVGSLLLELNADNQWSVQHRAVPRANHLHSMFRDLSFRWDYDAGARHDADHHHGPAEPPH